MSLHLQTSKHKRTCIIDLTTEKRQWNPYKQKSGKMFVHYPCCKQILIKWEMDAITKCMKHNTVPTWQKIISYR